MANEPTSKATPARKAPTPAKAGSDDAKEVKPDVKSKAAEKPAEKKPVKNDAAKTTDKPVDKAAESTAPDPAEVAPKDEKGPNDAHVTAHSDDNPLLTPAVTGKEVAADKRREKSALERKADVLEKSGGDPAKVAELRHQAPAVRTEANKSLAEQDLGSAPTVRDAEAYARRRAEEARDLAEKEGMSEDELSAKGKQPGNLKDARGKNGPIPGAPTR